MRKHAGVAVLVFLTTIGAQYAPSSGTSEGRAPALGEILDRMQQAQKPNEQPYHPYTVTRKYNLFRNDPEHPISKVRAEISSILPGKQEYEIKRASGSSIGKKIVRKILDWETEPVKDDNAISRRNYDFCFLREENLDSHSTYVLGIVPRRNQKDLFNGEIWVDAKIFRVRRIEGRLARKPSWWVTQHHIVLQFAEVKGLWIHTSTEITAIIRIFGKYMLTAQEVDLTLLSSAACSNAPF
ncbi:MAG TPA: hypothetical protein VJP02_08135 [Candidatus Sulfotelmatobacter sp.]|nr:hypothetical protein [Candidatus Sulfotelmatobacter sp.]